MLKTLGITQPGFCSHSFCIGMATQMLEDGATLDEIKAAGRWRSDSFKLYIRPMDPNLHDEIHKCCLLHLTEEQMEIQALTKTNARPKTSDFIGRRKNLLTKRCNSRQPRLLETPAPRDENQKLTHKKWERLRKPDSYMKGRRRPILHIPKEHRMCNTRYEHINPSSPNHICKTNTLETVKTTLPLESDKEVDITSDWSLTQPFSLNDN